MIPSRFLTLSACAALLSASAAFATGPFMVWFASGSAELDALDRDTIRFAYEEIRRIGPAGVRLWASADTVGSASFNLRLSRRRGEAVKAELVRLGLSPDNIHIAATGETRLLSETADEVSEVQNRIVMFEYLGPFTGL